MRKKFFFKLTALLFIFILLINSFSFLASAAVEDAPDTSQAEAVFLYNINTNKIIVSKNLDKPIFTGSITKMMCGMLFCEQFGGRLDDTVEITKEMLANVSGAKIKLVEGDIVTYKDLLYGVVCGGGNDACHALAVACAGSVDAYVSLMNEVAYSWGLKDTYFSNPSGYDDTDMHTTAADVLMLAKKAYQNELYMEASSSLSYTVKPQSRDKEIKLFNRNSLISSFYASGYQNKHAYGLIAGFTDLGQYTAVTYLEKGDTQFLCAVMGAKEQTESKEILSYKYINELSEYAFNNYQYKKIFSGGKYICSLDVSLALPDADSDVATVDCYTSGDVYALIDPAVSGEDDLVYGYYLHDKNLSAPIREHSVVGGVDIFYKGTLVGSTKLVTGENVQENSILYSMDRMKSFFLDRFFLLTVAFFVIILTAYLIIDVKARPKKVSKSKKLF